MTLARRIGVFLLGVALVGIVARAGGAAEAAGPPTAITGPVSSVTGTSATLTGTVNPNGVSTTYHFDYGTSTSYGSKTASTSAGSGTANQTVAASVSGLSPAATYHYRLVATSSAGTANGADGIFTTAAPPTVTTGSASEIGPFKAVLNGTVDPNGRPTDFYFEYGTSTSYGSQTQAASAGSGTSAKSVSALVTGLSAGKTYHFRLVATSDAGTSRGSDRTFSTDSPPTATTGNASSIEATSAKLNGSVNPRGRTTTYYFEYGTSTSYGSKTPTGDAGAGNSTKSVSATVTGLAPATTYHFRLVATSDAGTSTGSDRSFTTRTAPTVVTGSATGIGLTSATLNGSVNPNGRSTDYWFEYGTSSAYGSRTQAKGAGSGTSPKQVSVGVGGLRPATTYHFRLVARNSAGSAFGADQTFSTFTAPAAETGIATSIRPISATLTGRVDPNGQTTTYAFEYGTGTAYGLRTQPGTLGAAVGPQPVAAGVRGLREGTVYHYRLVASNAAGSVSGRDRTFQTPRFPRAPNGTVVRCTMIGTQGNDTFRGTPGRDVVCGFGGNDRIVAGPGNDLIYGGDGADLIQGGAGDDVIYAGGQNDIVFGGDGNDVIDGGGGRNTLSGGAGADVIRGGPLADQLDGGPGRDKLYGNAGSDVLLARDRRSDLVDGGRGRDRARLDRRLDRAVSIEVRRY